MKNDFFLSKMFKSHFLRQEITGMFFWKKLNRPREVLKSFNGPEPGGLESTDKKVKQREMQTSTATMENSVEIP